MRLFVILVTTIVCVSFGIASYEGERTKLLNEEFKLTLGGSLVLTTKEENVNKCLMGHKQRELQYYFEHPEYFNMSHHFFSYKERIRKSKVYKIIKDLPKGAVLHVHDMGILGPDYLMNITYMENLHICRSEPLLLEFAETTPRTLCSTQWKLLSDVRKASQNVTAFDSDLRKHFTMVCTNPDMVYPSITQSWDVFMNYFRTVAPMLSYRPVWEQYFYDVLKKFKEDNIMYVEVRSILPILYELDGSTYEQLMTAKAYRKAIRRFVIDNPDFVGAKLIFAPSRKVNNQTLASYLQLANEIKSNMPTYFAGFDLVGQEDKGYPLVEFVSQLTEAAKNLDFFFHAGETDWYGSLTDENLVDAILLGAKRIGHAYALPKHPLLMKEVVKSNIGIEVNVVSNSVLSLVRDIRNHPLSTFFANDLPVVLSSDDPGAWEADPISDDFYVAFMAVASKQSDLRMLKKLALNSLEFSALGTKAKVEAMHKFHIKWDHFIDEFNCSKY